MQNLASLILTIVYNTRVKVEGVEESSIILISNCYHTPQIVPYSSSLVSVTTTTTTTATPCSSDIRSFLCPTPHSAIFSTLSFHDNAQDSAHSDTELFGPSSRLQNRIARKINRLKSRRLGVHRPRSKCPFREGNFILSHFRLQWIQWIIHGSSMKLICC